MRGAKSRSLLTAVLVVSLNGTAVASEPTASVVDEAALRARWEGSLAQPDPQATLQACEQYLEQTNEMTHASTRLTVLLETGEQLLATERLPTELRDRMLLVLEHFVSAYVSTREVGTAVPNEIGDLQRRLREVASTEPANGPSEASSAPSAAAEPVPPPAPSTDIPVSSSDSESSSIQSHPRSQTAFADSSRTGTPRWGIAAASGGGALMLTGGALILAGVTTERRTRRATQEGFDSDGGPPIDDWESSDEYEEHLRREQEQGDAQTLAGAISMGVGLAAVTTGVVLLLRRRGERRDQVASTVLPLIGPSSAGLSCSVRF